MNIKRYISLDKLLNKNLTLMIIGNIITISVNVAMVKLLTNKYSTTDFGIYSFTMAFTVFPQLILFAPISASIFPFSNKYKSLDSKSTFQKEVYELFYIITIILVLLLVGFIILNYFLEIINTGINILLIISIFFSFSISSLNLLDSFSLANSNIKEYVFFPLLNLTIKVFILFILLNFNYFTPTCLILIFSIIQLILFVIEESYLRKKGIMNYKALSINVKSFKLITPIKTEIYNYSKNFSIWGLFGWLQSFLDKYSLQYYCNNSTVAIYSVYYQYGFFPFTILSSIFSQYITPIYFSKLEIGGDILKSYIRKLLFNTTLVLIVSLICLPLLSVFIAPFFIKTLTNENYLENINDFPIIVLAGVFYCFAQIITVPLLSVLGVKKVKFPKISTSILAVCLFFILVSKFQLLGIFLALLISNFYYFMILFFMNIKTYKEIKL
jgi:O-antigen/teichoic acid export membrane protein